MKKIYQRIQAIIKLLGFAQQTEKTQAPGSCPGMAKAPHFAACVSFLPPTESNYSELSDEIADLYKNVSRLTELIKYKRRQFKHLDEADKSGRVGELIGYEIEAMQAVKSDYLNKIITDPGYPHTEAGKRMQRKSAAIPKNIFEFGNHLYVCGLAKRAFLLVQAGHTAIDATDISKDPNYPLFALAEDKGGADAQMLFAWLETLDPCIYAIVAQTLGTTEQKITTSIFPILKD